MIVDIDYMINESGFAIECDDTKIQKAIGMGEGIEVALMLGDNYTTLRELATDDPTDALIVGGMTTDTEGNSVYTVGVKEAIGNIVFAWLLSNNIAATTFGAVRKKDDYSENVDPFSVCRQYYGMGRQMLKQICDIKGWKLNLGLGYYMEQI